MEFQVQGGAEALLVVFENLVPSGPEGITLLGTVCNLRHLAFR
jgi:hypothetical protein